MKEALGTFKMAKKTGHGGRTYFSPRIYLPTKLVTDSAFPLKSEDMPVLIRIKNRKITVERATQRILEKHGHVPPESMQTSEERSAK